MLQLWNQKETDVAIVEPQNKNCHSDSKPNAWIEIIMILSIKKQKQKQNNNNNW